MSCACAIRRQSTAKQTAQPAASAAVQTAPKKTLAPVESEPLTEEDAGRRCGKMARRGETGTTVMKGRQNHRRRACWTFAAGTASADGGKFTAMYHYAVSTTGRGLVWTCPPETG